MGAGDDLELVRERLRERIALAGSVSAFARATGYSQSYVSHVLAGDDPPSDRLLAAIGLERRIVPAGNHIRD